MVQFELSRRDGGYRMQNPQWPPFGEFDGQQQRPHAPLPYQVHTLMYIPKPKPKPRQDGAVEVGGVSASSIIIMSFVGAIIGQIIFALIGNYQTTILGTFLIFKYLGHLLRPELKDDPMCGLTTGGQEECFWDCQFFPDPYFGTLISHPECLLDCYEEVL